MQNQQTSRKGHRPDAPHQNPRGVNRPLTKAEKRALADLKLASFYAGDVRLALGGGR